MNQQEFKKAIQSLGIKSGDLVEVTFDQNQKEILKFCGGPVMNEIDSEWVAFVKPNQICVPNGEASYHIGHIINNGIKLMKKIS